MISRLEKMVLSLAIGLGLLFVFIIPPFQKTDEVVHYYKAISVAAGQLKCRTDAAGSLAALLPRYLVSLPTDIQAQRVIADNTVKFPISAYRLGTQQLPGISSKIPETSGCALPFVWYIPAGLTLALPVLLGMNPFVIFFLGRIANYVCALLIFYISFRIIPKRFRFVLVYLLTLPMVLIQLGSYNKEVFHFAFGALSFSMLMAMRDKTLRMTPLSLLGFFVSLGLFVLPRPQYVFMFLTVLLLPLDVISHTIKRIRLRPLHLMFIGMGAVLIAAIGLMVIHLYLPTLSFFHRFAHDFRGVYPNLQMRYLLEHPFYFFTVLSNSLAEYGKSYIEGYVGVLGYIHYYLQWYVYTIYIVATVWVGYKLSHEVRNTSWFEFIVLNCIVWGTFFALFLAMYVYSTPVALDTIYDVQGRYFIMLMPFVLWMMSFIFHRLRTYLVYGAGIIIGISVVWSIYTRYYDYNRFFYQSQYVGVTFTEDAKLLRIGDTFVYSLPVEKGKKLAGVAILTHPQGDSTTKPYVVTLARPNSKIALRQKVIDVGSMKKNSFVQIPFDPILITDDVIHVHFRPYAATGVGPKEYLYVVKDTQNTEKLIISPLYLY